MQKFENKHESEIETVQNLITALDLTGVVMTFDSLHCQKADAIAPRKPRRALHQANL
jgi:predicted transposase YbfD/YdcC